MADIWNELRTILTTHIASLKADADYISRQILEEPDPDLRDLSGHTHKFKGGSGTAGFKDLHEISQRLHERITTCADAGQAPDDDIRTLTRQLRAMAAALTIEHSTLLPRQGV